MARQQTVFSELIIGKTIGDCPIRSIKKVTKEDISKYNKEFKKRKEANCVSIAQLQNAGKKIKDWLLKKKKIHLKNIQVEWMGPEKKSGDQSVAEDLRISVSPEATIRISVKEDAQLFQNPSPVKVFDKWPKGLFDESRDEDWFIRVASKELNEYYCACGGPKLTGQATVENYYKNVRGKDKNGIKLRKKLTNHVASLHDQSKEGVLEAYEKLCRKVSESSATIFNENLKETYPEIEKGTLEAKNISQLFSFFFKLDRNEHILCGTENNEGFAVLIHDLETWESKFSITNINAIALVAGQPEVKIIFSFRDKKDNKEFSYWIKSEIRWSHGKFCGNPESKLYKSWSYTNLVWARPL